MTADFLSGLMEIKRKWNNLFKSVKKKKKKSETQNCISNIVKISSGMKVK